MRKRRKLFVILGLIALAVVGFFTLRPRDEPKYQGRYLSEWMAVYRDASDQYPMDFDKMGEAQRAVRAIGTNALPYFIKWMHAPAESRMALRDKLPSWVRHNRTVDGWFVRPAVRRLHYGLNGMQILRTNAANAFPELEAMMYDRTKPLTAVYAVTALGYVGEQAIPVLKTALTDQDRGVRVAATNVLRVIAPQLLTNAPAP